MGNGPNAALSGVRVVDATDALGAYAGRLLVGLGADVVRVEKRGPSKMSPEDIYSQIGKSIVQLDVNAHEDRKRLLEMLGKAEIVLESGNLLHEAGITRESALVDYPNIVWTNISPFGLEGPDADTFASDLTLMARGGLMWLAGEPGRAPLRPAGHQANVASGLYGAVASLLAFRHAEATGSGQLVSVPALEVIVSALENSAQYWDLEKVIRMRKGSKPQEAGSGLYECLDGYIYVMAGRLTTPRGWDEIVKWLNESDIPGAAELRCEQWSNYEYRTRPEATEFFGDIFRRFTKERSKVELYEEGQRRGIVVCPINTPIDLLTDRQLVYRKFFQPIELSNVPTSIQVPRAPFVLSRTPFCSGQVAVRTESDQAPNWKVRSPRTPDRTVSGQKLPLSGIRVVDFTWVGAGPFATKILADHGAEVIKIESSTRQDALRGTPPFLDGKAGVNRSGYFANRNTSKKSVTLNLRDPRAVELARQLIAKSDIVANSFTPGTMEKWGLDYAGCRELRSDIIYLEMPMHAGEGPHGHNLGYGAAISALSGLFGATGYPGTAPTGTGTNYPDHVPNPVHAALAMLAALRHRDLSGEGQAIELSQVESSIFAFGSLVVASQMSDWIDSSRPLENREPGVAPHGVYPAAESDRWVALACWNDGEWEHLSELAGRSWDSDPRFSTLSGRLANQDTLDSEIAAWTATQQLESLVLHLRQRGLDAAPVQNARDVVDADVQLRQLGHWVRLDHPEMPQSLYDSPPFRLYGTPGGLMSAAPLLGQHTESVCRDLLGMSKEELAELKLEGVLD